MSYDVHALLRRRLDSARKDYVADLMAMTTEQLNTSPGGAARTPYDFTYEVVFVNRRIAQRLRGEVPSPYPAGWLTSPEEFRVRERAVEELTQSVDEILAAWNALPSDEIGKGYMAANGDEVAFVDVMLMASYHMGYHDAQLNYLQAILGDPDVHWE